MPLRNVHLIEFTMIPGNLYSATLGYLQAAAQSQPDLAAGLTFHRHVRSQSAHSYAQECERMLDSMDDPLVVAFTIFFWNRPASLDMARRVKERWPSCHVIIGGNDVTNQQDAVFGEAPWVDLLVHGEGELRFPELLRRVMNAGPAADRAETFAGIDGISYRMPSGDVITAPAGDRIADLSLVPSPLLSDVYSDAELASTHVFVYETNRGCPYSCAFCYWGGYTNSKVRQFPIERIEAELDRIIRVAKPFAQIFIADANFGIIARDAEIAQLVIDICHKYNKRVVVLTNWAKNTSDRVVKIAHMLYGAGLCGAITLSAQSFDAEVLQIANRSNIRVGTYRKMQQRLRELSVPTYTDLIWGLPGESLAKYRDSIEEIIQSGGSPVVYPLLLLNNTEYTKEKFRADYRIKARRLPCNPGVDELAADCVVEHSAMSFDDWIEGLMLRLTLCVFYKSLLHCTLRLISERTGTRVIDLVQLLVRFLDTECSDQGIVTLARNHAESWRNPDDYNRKIVLDETGIGVMGEELHFQAIVARMARNPVKLRELLTEAVGFLRTSLGSGSGFPSQSELDGVMSLDLAGAAAFRAGLLHEVEEIEFRVGPEALEVLHAFGDVPAELGEQGMFSVAIERTRYPYSAYAISVWHGSGRPLHDLTLSVPQHLLELA